MRVVRNLVLLATGAIVFASVAAAAFAPSSTVGSTPTTRTAPTATTRPGSAAVYAEIAAETSCVSLQEMFDRAEANGKAARNRGNLPLAIATTSYMSAADDRMRAIGCY